MQKSRYIDVRAFCNEATKLRAKSSAVTLSDLERLERQRSLIPKLRLHYPDEIERRWWLEAHSEEKVAGPLAPDGPVLDAARELERARQSTSRHVNPEVFVHPLDAPEERFQQFIEQPRQRSFAPWKSYRVDVSESLDSPRYNDQTVVTYYSAWQLLQFAEVVNMGVLQYVNLEIVRPCPDPKTSGEAKCFIWPRDAMRGFDKHERALDATVWFSEEAARGYMYATRLGNGRRMLTNSEREEIEHLRQWAATQAIERYRIGYPELLVATKFLCERWNQWNDEGRPLLAGAYKSLIYDAVRLCRLVGRLDYAAIRDAVGLVGGYFKPILDVIWVDWATERRADARRIFISYNRSDSILRASFDEKLVDAFLDFIDSQGLQGFYWRLESFNHHAFRGNEHSVEGLKGDVQGMAVVLEHIAGALGAKRPQLYDKFKELVAGHLTILKRLKSDEVARNARAGTIDLGWFDGQQGKGEVNEICADLAISYAIRGGAHRIIQEDDSLKLERMMLILLRTSLRIFQLGSGPPALTPTAEK